MRNRLMDVVLLAGVALILGACSGDAATQVPTPSAIPLEPTERPTASEATTQPSATETAVLEGKFDVGGHQLYLRCVGSGAPTVVYFHGYIQDAYAGGSSLNAKEIPGLLQDRYRVCVWKSVV